MNDIQIACFLAVSEHLNFTKAAEQLHITHPAVSQQIQSLEKELGVRLFQRTTRSVRLTEEGKMFVNDARQLMALSSRAKKRFQDTSYKEIEILSECWRKEIWMQSLVSKKQQLLKSLLLIKKLRKCRWYASAPAAILLQTKSQ